MNTHQKEQIETYRRSGISFAQIAEMMNLPISTMKHYFDTILAGSRTETDISEEMLTQLPLFIDMVLIENIVDEFECCARDGELPDDEEIQDASEYLIKGIPCPT